MIDPRVEIRRELAEMEANEASLDPGLYKVLHASLLADLAELEAPASPIEEAPMPKKYDPSEKRDALLGRLRAAQADGKPDHKIACLLRAHCQEHGFPVPEEARLKRETPTPRKAAPAPEPRLSRPMEAAIDLGRAIAQHHGEGKPAADVRTHLRGIRRQVWMLMADLEGLTSEQLAELQNDLGLLDSAAHAAHQLAQGRLEVA